MVSRVTVCKYDIIVDLGITTFVDDGGRVVVHISLSCCASLSLSITVLIITESN